MMSAKAKVRYTNGKWEPTKLNWGEYGLLKKEQLKKVGSCHWQTLTLEKMSETVRSMKEKLVLVCKTLSNIPKSDKVT